MNLVYWEIKWILCIDYHTFMSLTTPLKESFVNEQGEREIIKQMSIEERWIHIPCRELQLSWIFNTSRLGWIPKVVMSCIFIHLYEGEASPFFQKRLCALISIYFFFYYIWSNGKLNSRSRNFINTSLDHYITWITIRDKNIAFVMILTCQILTQLYPFLAEQIYT